MTEHVDEHVVDDAERAADAGEASDPQTESVEALKQQLEAARQESSQNYDRYLRARADMDNYKRRVERTYADLAKAAKKDLLTKLLSVKDNLERALQYGQGTDEAGEGIMEGVRLTQYQLDQLLAQEGVKPIDAEGKPFDPHLEEAVHSVDDPEVPDHTVVQVVRRGYTYQDEVLRPAQVVVSVHDGDK